MQGEQERPIVTRDEPFTRRRQDHVETDGGCVRIFSRFEKLDVMFVGFIHFALIVEGLRFSVNRL